MTYRPDTPRPPALGPSRATTDYCSASSSASSPSGCSPAPIGTVARSILTDINGGPIDKVANPLVTLDQMNLAVSITALFSGLFIVFMGGLADRIGRVRIAFAGNGLGIVGRVLVILATGSAPCRSCSPAAPSRASPPRASCPRRWRW